MSDSGFVKNEDQYGDPVCCSCCGYDATTKRYDAQCDGLDRSFFFCEVCYSTFLSSAVLFPQQCPDQRLYRSVAWIANRLLEEVRRTADG